MHKPDAWIRHMKSVNPDITVQGWNRELRCTDGAWLAGLLRGEGWEDDTQPVDLVFLGTTSPEANLVAGRCCAQAHVRMIIGPASSGSWMRTRMTMRRTTIRRKPRSATETLSGGRRCPMRADSSPSP